MTKLEALPEHLLQLVVDRLSLPDVIRLGCACKAMKSICGPLQFPNHLPWLIVPTTGDQEEVGFLSLCDGKVYKAQIPQLYDRRICGSFPGGWLMTVHHNSDIQLFNPFSSKSESTLIHLPPLNKFPGVDETITVGEEEGLYYYSGVEYGVCRFRMEAKYMRDTYIRKVAISSSSKGTVIMTIQSIEKALAFYTIGSGGENWSPATPPNHSMRFFQDLTYYRGSFYAVNEKQVVVVVPTTLYAQPIISLPPSNNSYSGEELYILESSGDLLLVIRSMEKRIRQTIGFRVFRLKFGTPNQWEEVPTLGNRSLFLGFNQSYSLSALHFSGCKPNSIYFTDTTSHHWLGFGGHDSGIFTLQDATIHKFMYPIHTILLTPPPIWFTPYPSSKLLLDEGRGFTPKLS